MVFTKEEIGVLQCPNIKIPGIIVHLIVRMSKQKHEIDVKHNIQMKNCLNWFISAWYGSIGYEVSGK